MWFSWTVLGTGSYYQQSSNLKLAPDFLCEKFSIYKTAFTSFLGWHNFSPCLLDSLGHCGVLWYFLVFWWNEQWCLVLLWCFLGFFACIESDWNMQKLKIIYECYSNFPYFNFRVITIAVCLYVHSSDTFHTSMLKSLYIHNLPTTVHEKPNSRRNFLC